MHNDIAIIDRPVRCLFGVGVAGRNLGATSSFARLGAPIGAPKAQRCIPLDGEFDHGRRPQ